MYTTTSLWSTDIIVLAKHSADQPWMQGSTIQKRPLPWAPTFHTTMAHYTFALLATTLLSASAAQAQGLCFVQAPQSYNCADGNLSRMDAVTSAMIAGNGALARQLLDQLYPGDQPGQSGSR